MEYLSLAIVGSLLILGTSVFDYYFNTYLDSDAHISEKPKHPHEVPVGSKEPPEESGIYKYLERVDPVFIGYIIGVLLQTPLLLSVVGVI